MDGLDYVNMYLFILAIYIVIKAAIRTPSGFDIDTSEGMRELGIQFIFLIPAFMICMGAMTLMERSGVEWMYELAGVTFLLLGAIMWYAFTVWRRDKLGLEQ